MNILQTTRRFLLLQIMSVAVPGAFGAGTEITTMNAAADGDTVRIEIGLTSPVKPNIHVAGQMGLLVLDFPNVGLQTQSRRITINRAGVGDVHAAVHSAVPLDTWIVVRIDSARPYEIETAGNKLVLRIPPHPAQAAATAEKHAVESSDDVRVNDANTADAITGKQIAALTIAPPPEVERIPLASGIDAVPDDDCPATVRHRFKIKFIAGNTAYIDGGSNAGLRVGMNVDIRDGGTSPEADEGKQTPIGAARIVGVATTSAILEVGRSNGELKVGDWADLLPQDADAARKNVISGPANTLHADARPLDNDDDAITNTGKGFRPAQTIKEEPEARTVGRIGLDYSGISSTGSTPGGSAQLGMSFQSDIRHIMGTHWNLEGYWRGRINRHSQFQEPTIEDSLNKTYTMQLYYDNPNSRWVAGVGRLYLPWAVSLDTIDGGYLGRKFPLRNTSGIFAGSTPDLSSWHYRPNQKIGGVFTNFEGGDYEGFHYSSTSGAALTSIQWKLDRPYAFFENELSYKGRLSAFHSLIVDSPQGVSTNGIRPGAGVSHSYLTLHYQPKSVVSFDLYHNFFRDVPTAVTSIVGTGLVDKLLFQGISAGTHIRPSRYFTLYTTLGTSEKTGDTRRTLNQMYGATLNEVGRSGIRADFHYSKFDSNFGYGHYGVLSLSRQVTNRMYWNVQLGKQDIVSLHTLDCDSNFADDSIDFNLGRHSYLQSGFTYVKGETMDYRQWYMSWGYRFDEGKRTPQYVKTLVQEH
jgi:AMIN domain